MQNSWAASYDLIEKSRWMEKTASLLSEFLLLYVSDNSNVCLVKIILVSWRFKLSKIVFFFSNCKYSIGKGTFSLITLAKYFKYDLISANKIQSAMREQVNAYGKCSVELGIKYLISVSNIFRSC